MLLADFPFPFVLVQADAEVDEGPERRLPMIYKVQVTVEEVQPWEFKIPPYIDLIFPQGKVP